MRRTYEWVEKLEDRTKRGIRVCFPGGGKIVWMCLNPDDERWNRNITPTNEQWDFLESKVRGRYNRRRAPFDDVVLVVALRQKMVANMPPQIPAAPVSIASDEATL